MTGSRQASDPGCEEHRGHLGELSARATLRGRPRPVNDTWVAARCIACELPLATLNVKDFSGFADNDGLKLVMK